MPPDAASRYFPIFSCRYCIACPTVRSFSASSSGMSMSNSFSKAMPSATVSRLSAPRSSMKLASDVSLSRSTPSSSTMMSLTFSSSCFISIAMGDLKGGVGNGSQYHPAVDDQELPRNVAGEVGGEKEHGGGHILALAQPPQRDCLDQCLPRLGADAARQLGVDEPRRHGVHQDLARGKLLGHRLREPDEARLRGGVVRLAFVAGDPHDARDVDDPTPAPLDHPAGGVLRHQEGALEVGVEHGVPVVFVDAEQQVIPRGARVVHEHVDLLEFLLDRRDRLLYLCRLADVARAAARPVAERPRPPPRSAPGPRPGQRAPPPASSAARGIQATQRTGAVNWSPSSRRARFASRTASAVALAITGNAGSRNGARSSATRS